ncbi:hypothetical protein Fmac_033072 [Flemingia macrophylla]|uniref:Uncharacterized protein n=1 Tax=Flemingia macrophylla TaxID=520843 RepID=A0ABD1L6Q3_9FABA
MLGQKRVENGCMKKKTSENMAGAGLKEFRLNAGQDNVKTGLKTTGEKGWASCCGKSKKSAKVGKVGLDHEKRNKSLDYIGKFLIRA